MNATTKKPGLKGQHPFMDINNPKVKLEEGEDLFLCLQFLESICTQPCCDRISGHKRNQRCSCLCILIGSDARQMAVAKYMVAFANKPQQERHSIIMEWLRYTPSMIKKNDDRCCFFIPFLASDDDDDEQYDDEMEEEPLLVLKDWMVCKNAISILLDYGRYKWRTCQTAVLKNRLPEHGNKGKLNGPNVSFATEVKVDLHEFFHQIKQFGSPKTTRFVREETGSGLRDEEENLLELPTCWSKRGVYARFCFERGFVVTSTHSGNTKKSPRTDQLWNESNKKRICSWSSFTNFWEAHYPLIRIGSPSADICTDCHIFFNKSKFNAGDEDTTTVEVNMPNSDAMPNYLSDIGAADEGAAIADVGANDDEEEQIDLQLNSTPIEVQEREAILLKATLHVKQAIIQRQLANNKIQQAIETADLPHENRRYCFIADYSQNMELPYFGASQPGDTYYFSALKINVFGIVDCSLFGGKLSAHVYHEGVGKKGGNNVASLLVNELNRLNILQPDKTGKELTIIMDNCAGQNKNRMVLRLANYLVEADFFETVNFIFYVVGHTKNACDRWFNTLKKNYRRRNIYSFDQMIDSMKTNSKINVTVTKESDFKNWDKFFDQHYKRFVLGTTHKTHIFSTRPHFFFALMIFLKPFNHPKIYSKKDKH